MIYDIWYMFQPIPIFSGIAIPIWTHMLHGYWPLPLQMASHVGTCTMPYILWDKYNDHNIGRHLAMAFCRRNQQNIATLGVTHGAPQMVRRWKLSPGLSVTTWQGMWWGVSTQQLHWQNRAIPLWGRWVMSKFRGVLFGDATISKETLMWILVPWVLACIS